MAADLDYQPSSGQRLDWLAALYAAEPDLNGAFDGVALHPYSFYPPSAGPDSAAQDFRFDRVAAIERELATHGAADKPVWITELGWSTCDLRPDCTSDHDQAQRLADAFTLIRSSYASFVRAVFVFHLEDFPGDASNNREGRYGLLNLDGSRKPAWSVVRAEAKLSSR
jgi:exo-beta-1,3-glucanase (GH17 family)